MIAEDKALSELVGRLSECPRIALDTEADSLHCYFEKLCLIQVSAGDEHVLVDPLAGIDLPAGCQTLRGPEALGYVRSRATARADLDRMLKQREFQLYLQSIKLISQMLMLRK